MLSHNADIGNLYLLIDHVETVLDGAETPELRAEEERTRRAQQTAPFTAEEMNFLAEKLVALVQKQQERSRQAPLPPQARENRRESIASVQVTNLLRETRCLKELRKRAMG